MRKLETGLEMVRAVCCLQWEWRGFREMLKVIEWTRPGGKIDTQWDKEQSGMILSSNFSDQVGDGAGETIRRKGSFEEKDKGVHSGHAELRSP